VCQYVKRVMRPTSVKKVFERPKLSYVGHLELICSFVFLREPLILILLMTTQDVKQRHMEHSIQADVAFLVLRENVSQKTII
jgi:hypothetical protein